MKPRANEQMRNTRILDAIKTSFWSKGSTLLLQFVSLPLVARKMGPEMFGIYATFSAVIGLAAVLDLGIGPALARKISAGVAENDQSKQVCYFRTGVVIVGAISAAVLLAGAILSLIGQATLLFGQKYLGHADLMQNGFWVVIVLLILQVLTSMGSKARAGFQEIHLNNAFSAAGNVSVAIFLLVAAWIQPSVLVVLLVVHGAGLMAQSANLAHLLRARPYLLGKAGDRVDVPAARQLLADGVCYAVAIGLLAAQRELGKIFLGRIEGPWVVGNFSILTSILNMGGGFLVMFTAAIWPAIADAENRGDSAWLGKLWRKLNRHSAWYAVGVGLLIALFGNTFVQLLYGRDHAMSGLTFSALGLYFGILVIAHVRFTWLLGHGRMGVLAIVTLLEFLCNSLAMLCLRRWLSIEVLLIIFALNHLIFSVLVQSRLSRQYFASLFNPVRMA